MEGIELEVDDDPAPGDVDEALRQGVGTQLLSRSEAAARDRRCVGAWLDTLGSGARPFSEQLGYRQFAALADFPPGHRRHLLMMPR